MHVKTVQPDEGRVKRVVVIIIIIVWLIMTLRYGAGWLTPAELAFFVLVLNPSSFKLPSIGS